MLFWKRARISWADALFIALSMQASFPTFAAADEVLRVGRPSAAAFTMLPLDVGQKVGIFAKHGITLELSASGGAAKAHQALAAGALDAIVSGGPELALVQRGAPEKAVAVIAGVPTTLSVVVRPDGPIKTVDDLKGKKLSITTAGSLTEWLADELSHKKGWGKDGIKPVALGAEPAQIAAFKAGQIDGLIIDVSLAYQLADEGSGKLLLKFSDVLDPMVGQIVFFRKELLDKRPAVVTDFLKGWFETIRYMREHKAEVVKMVQPLVNLPESVVSRTYDAAMPHFTLDGTFTDEGVKRLSDSLVAQGKIQDLSSIKAAYTNEFLPK